MDILFLLIPLSVVLALVIGWSFWRAVDTGQFDDLDTPALKVVADDDSPARTIGNQVASGPAANAGAPRLTQIKDPPPLLFTIDEIITERSSQP